MHARARKAVPEGLPGRAFAVLEQHDIVSLLAAPRALPTSCSVHCSTGSVLLRSPQRPFALTSRVGEEFEVPTWR